MCQNLRLRILFGSALALVGAGIILVASGVLILSIIFQNPVVGTWQVDCNDGGVYNEVLRSNGSYTDIDVYNGKYNGTYKLQDNTIVYVRYFSSVPNRYVPDTPVHVTERLTWNKRDQFTITYQSADPPFPQDPPHRSCTAKRVSQG